MITQLGRNVSNRSKHTLSCGTANANGNLLPRLVGTCRITHASLKKTAATLCPLIEVKRPLLLQRGKFGF
jgi:hypothetical protein